MTTSKQQRIREILLKYTLPDSLKPEYDGMTAWELAGIILKEVEREFNPKVVSHCPKCGDEIAGDEDGLCYRCI